MSEDSYLQARKIGEMTELISTSSKQLQEVSGRAEQLSAQAQTSVQIAHNGAETVDRTINNMTTLREQIQDTAKHIKRLGESSQEISTIIEFMTTSPNKPTHWPSGPQRLDPSSDGR